MQSAKSVKRRNRSAVQQPEIHVVFDTNSLFTELADRLINAEVGNFVQTVAHSLGLSVSWYLPSTVINERRRQMIERGVSLLVPFRKMEALLGMTFGLSETTMELRVDEAIKRDMSKHALKELNIDTNLVDWRALIERAERRQPPFSSDTPDKGFKDALILETFLQHLDALSKSPQRCRSIFVSSDKLLEAAFSSMVRNKNASIVRDVATLKTVLNAIASHLEQDDLTKILEQASNLFYNHATGKGLAEKWELYSKNLAPAALKDKPGNDAGFTNDIVGWSIDVTQFEAKTGQKIFFQTDIELGVGATKYVQKYVESDVPNALMKEGASSGIVASSITTNSLAGLFRGSSAEGLGGLINIQNRVVPPPGLLGSLMGSMEAVKRRGLKRFAVRWTATLNVNGNLIRPELADISEEECRWEQVSSP